MKNWKSLFFYVASWAAALPIIGFTTLILGEKGIYNESITKPLSLVCYILMIVSMLWIFGKFFSYTPFNFKKFAYFLLYIFAMLSLLAAVVFSCYFVSIIIFGE